MPDSTVLDRLGYTARLDGVPFDDARARLVEALKAEGFGILTEIDITATLKAKLGVDFRRYVILGACNPTLAHAALSGDLAVGLLLPCNACVWDEGGATSIAVVKPEAMFALVDNDAIKPVMQDADARLQRAVRTAAGQ